MLNKYYESEINQQKKSVKTLLQSFNKLFKNGYQITCKIVTSLFTNNDMLNKSPEDIVSEIRDMRQRKLISLNQEISLCKNLLCRIYDKIHDDIQMGYISNKDQIPSYVYLVDIFWHDQDRVCKFGYGDISYKARQNMCKINNTPRARFYSLDLVLEKHFVELHDISP